jgi:hypothetical protein
MEPTALETATTDVAATKSATTDVTATTKSTTTAVPSRPCYGTERHGCDANYQSNYLSYFHISTFRRALPVSDCASARFRGVP